MSLNKKIFEEYLEREGSVHIAFDDLCGKFISNENFIRELYTELKDMGFVCFLTYHEDIDGDVCAERLRCVEKRLEEVRRVSGLALTDGYISKEEEMYIADYIGEAERLKHFCKKDNVITGPLPPTTLDFSYLAKNYLIFKEDDKDEAK